MCKIVKSPYLCKNGVCYVGRGWEDDPEEPNWYLNFTHKPIRGQNLFYYIDSEEDHDPDCVVDFTKKLDMKFPSGVFSIVFLEFLPTSCFDEETYTIPNAAHIVKSGGLVLVASSEGAANTAAQRMREASMKNVKVVKRVTAQVYSEKGMKMAKKANAMLIFRLEPEKYKKVLGDKQWEEAEEIGAEINADYWVAMGKKP